MTHSLWAQEVSAFRCSGNVHYKSSLSELFGATIISLGNNDFEFFFNEGSSFQLVCFIPTVITHTQELLSSLLESFILEFQTFTTAMIHDNKINQECKAARALLGLL